MKDKCEIAPNYDELWMFYEEKLFAIWYVRVIDYNRIGISS
jgi:hypothetical protein